jgi:hypothetical protein
MNRRLRATIAILAIPPVTVAGVGLIRCGCTAAAYTIELLTALLYLFFVLVAPRS